jgi:hypothetical protein
VRQRESIRLWSFSFDAASGRSDAAGTPISPDGGQVVMFGSTRGQPLGEPFQVTHFDSPGFVIGPSIVSAELGISARRVVLQMATITGNIWLLEGIDQ